MTSALEITVTPEMVEAGKNERMECFKTTTMPVGEALTRIYQAMRSADPADHQGNIEELKLRRYRIEAQSEQIAAQASALAAKEAEIADAAKFIRVLGEEFVLAGFPAGDRTVTLQNVRAVLATLTRVRAALAPLREMEKRATPGPYYVSHDDADDCPDHRDSGLAMIDTGRASDWPIARLCHWPDAELHAATRNLLPTLFEAAGE